MTSASHFQPTPQAPAHRPMIGPIPHSLAVAQAVFAAHEVGIQEPKEVRSPVNTRTGKIDCTLLEVVEAIADVAENDEEVFATLAHMLESGRIRLSQLPQAQPTQSVVYC